MISPRIAATLFLALVWALTVTPVALRGWQRATTARADGPSPVERVVQSANEQTTYTRYYDPTYVKLAYPGGDVPRERGVCTDVVVRAFRAAGVDLQKEIHLDMAANFSAYPNRWGNKRPDRNIDHRRVSNLMNFFERQGRALRVTASAEDFVPGDVVA